MKAFSHSYTTHSIMALKFIIIKYHPTLISHNNNQIMYFSYLFQNFDMEPVSFSRNWDEEVFDEPLPLNPPQFKVSPLKHIIIFNIFLWVLCLFKYLLCKFLFQIYS